MFGRPDDTELHEGSGPLLTTATVKGKTPEPSQEMNIADPLGYANTNFTDRGTRFAGLANTYGADPVRFGAYGSDVGSANYQQDIWRQRMYETGGSTYEVDPSSQFLGGREGWADDYYNQMGNLSGQYAARQQPYMNIYDADMSNAQGNLMQADMARMAGAMGQTHAWNDLNAMSQDLGGIRAMAMGYGQSAAEMAMQRQAEETMRQNMAMASTARGAGANSALLQAAQQNAVGQGQLQRDLGVQRAQEQQQWANMLLEGSGQYMGAQDSLIDNYSQMRGQDLEAAVAAGNLSLDQARLLAEQEATRYGGAIDTQNANDAMVQFFMSQGMDAQMAQLAARQAYESSRTSNWLNKYGIDAGVQNEPTFWERTGEQALGAGITGAAYGLGSSLGSGSDKK